LGGKNGKGKGEREKKLGGGRVFNSSVKEVRGSSFLSSA